VQIERTGQELDVGLGICCSINDKLVASNDQARSLAQELGLAAASALAAAANGTAELNDATSCIRSSLEEASKMNKEIANVASGVSNLALKYLQVPTGCLPYSLNLCFTFLSLFVLFPGNSDTAKSFLRSTCKSITGASEHL
jgi:hypothetical protein